MSPELLDAYRAGLQGFFTKTGGCRRAATMLNFEEIARKVQAYRPGDDLALLRKAYDFSAAEHRAQKRLSGEPYLSHPLEVANVLADMKLDVVCLAGGML